MGILFGETDINRAYIGDAEVKKAFLGEELVYSALPGPNLLLNTRKPPGYYQLYTDSEVQFGVMKYGATSTAPGCKLTTAEPLQAGIYTMSFLTRGGKKPANFYCYFRDPENNTISAISSEGVASNLNTGKIGVSSEHKDYTRIWITWETKGNPNAPVTVTIGEYKSVTEPGTYPSGTRIYPIYLYGFKLEKGSVATDWVPNVNDPV